MRLSEKIQSLAVVQIFLISKYIYIYIYIYIVLQISAIAFPGWDANAPGDNTGKGLEKKILNLHPAVTSYNLDFSECSKYH